MWRGNQSGHFFVGSRRNITGSRPGFINECKPGLRGQKYIPSTTAKIRKLRTMMDERGIDAHIQVDGGVSTETIKEVYDTGPIY